MTFCSEIVVLIRLLNFYKKKFNLYLHYLLNTFFVLLEAYGIQSHTFFFEYV